MSDTKTTKQIETTKLVVASTEPTKAKGSIDDLIKVLQQVKEFRCEAVRHLCGNNPVPPHLAKRMEICFKLLHVISYQYPRDRSVPIDPSCDYYLPSFMEIVDHLEVLNRAVSDVEKNDKMKASEKKSTLENIRSRIKEINDLGMIESCRE